MWREGSLSSAFLRIAIQILFTFWSNRSKLIFILFSCATQAQTLLQLAFFYIQLMEHGKMLVIKSVQGFLLQKIRHDIKGPVFQCISHSSPSLVPHISFEDATIQWRVGWLFVALWLPGSQQLLLWELPHVWFFFVPCLSSFVWEMYLNKIATVSIFRARFSTVEFSLETFYFKFTVMLRTK